MEHQNWLGSQKNGVTILFIIFDWIKILKCFQMKYLAIITNLLLVCSEMIFPQKFVMFVSLFVTGLVSTGSAKNLGQSPMLGQS